MIKSGMTVRHISGITAEVVETRCKDVDGSPAVMVAIAKPGRGVPAYDIWRVDEIEVIDDEKKGE